MAEEFFLGDFVETLPYKGGAGSPDEYIANKLIIKRLDIRNKELAPSIIKLGKRYVPSTDEEYYIAITEPNEYIYSEKVAKLEVQLAELRKKITALKEIERGNGTARSGGSTTVLSVKEMTKKVLDRINDENDLLHPEEEDDL